MNKDNELSTLIITSVDDGCGQLAKILGLNKPVAPEVFYGALGDDTYANNLLTCREAPKFLEVLLNNPPKREKNVKHSEHEATHLLATASKALFKWARTGFLVAKEEVISERLRKCLQCPNMVPIKGGNVMYKVLKTKAICKLCGCDIEQKARINSEMCPDKDPSNKGYNRWGQSIDGVKNLS